MKGNIFTSEVNTLSHTSSSVNRVSWFSDLQAQSCSLIRPLWIFTPGGIWTLNTVLIWKPCLLKWMKDFTIRVLHPFVDWPLGTFFDLMRYSLTECIRPGRVTSYASRLDWWCSRVCLAPPVSFHSSPRFEELLINNSQCVFAVCVLFCLRFCFILRYGSYTNAVAKWRLWEIKFNKFNQPYKEAIDFLCRILHYILS